MGELPLVRVARVLYPKLMSLSPEHLVPRDSFLARRDPRWRLAAFLVAILGFACVRETGPSVCAAWFAMTLPFFARVRWQWFRNRFLALALTVIPFVILVPFVVDRGERLWSWAWLHVTDTGLLVAATLATKTIAVVVTAMTLMATAQPHETMAAAARIGVPRLLVNVAAMTYRYVFVLFDEFGRLRTALRVRGFRNSMSRHAYRTVGNVAGTLIVRGADRADRVAQAMRCRGFDGQFRSLARRRTNAGDVLLLSTAICIVGGLLAWDLLG